MKTEKRISAVAIFRLFILVLAIFLVVYGIIHGEAGAVFRKAASICLECIGIG